MFGAENRLKHLTNEIAELRSLCASLLTRAVELDLRTSKLESERYSRETELTDLRTRFETLIKRISARVDRPGVPEETPLHLRHNGRNR